MKELEKKELQIDGGFFWPAFVAGAIAGGILYDAWEEGVKNLDSMYGDGWSVGEWGPR